MTHRRLPTLAAAAVLTLAVGLTATAQYPAPGQVPFQPGFPGGIPGGNGNGNAGFVDDIDTTFQIQQYFGESGRRLSDTHFLKYPAVQEELKLGDEQKKKLEGIDRRRMARAFTPGRPKAATKGEQQSLFAPPTAEEVEAIGADQKRAVDEDEAAVAKVLTPKQRTRLAQVGLQVEGVMAFAREDVLEKLNIDEGQSLAIREVVDQARGEMLIHPVVRVDMAVQKDVIAVNKAAGTANPGSVTVPGDRQLQVILARDKAAGATGDAAMKKVARILRKSQRDAFNRLRGEPFDVASLQTGVKSKAPAAAAPAPAEAVTSPAAQPKPAEPAKGTARKTLRERRGGGPGGG